MAALALIGGFVAFYLREEGVNPELDDQKQLTGGAVLEYGCLRFVVVIVATTVIGLVQSLLFNRR